MSESHKDKMQKLKEEQRAKVASKLTRRGVIIVNTGDGKGKSSSAFGVALRAAGHGQRVAIVQFIKGKWRTGEQEAFKRFPEIDHVVSGDGFTWNTQDKAQDIASAEKGWAQARAFIEGGEHQVVILDEINIALAYSYLDVEQVVATLERKPEHVSVLLTGRGALAPIIQVADTVTEMAVVKHAFEAGVAARKGVEF